MAFDGSGNYALPAGNPVAPGTVIASAWANSTMTDIATALSNTVTRDGQGRMSVQFSVINGNSSVPSLAFTSETSTGWYKAGTGIAAFTALGAEVFRYGSNGSFLIGTTTDDGVNKLQVNGGTKVTGSFNATGNTTVGGTLGVTGVSTLAGLSATSGTFSSTLGVTGAATLAGLSATTGSFSSTLGVTGATTLAGVSATTGSFSSTLGVTGAVTMGSNLTVGGNVTSTSGGFSSGTSSSINNGTAADIQYSINKPGVAAAAFGLNTTGSTNALGVANNAVYIGVGAGSLSPGVIFTTANVERMRINATGEVGIGRTSAGAKFEVGGDAKSYNPSNTAIGGWATEATGVIDARMGVNNSGGTNIYGAPTNSIFFGSSQGVGLSLTTSAVERLRIDSSGRVGIGRAPTSSLLEVAGSIGALVPNSAADIGVAVVVNAVAAVQFGFNNSGSTNAYGVPTGATYLGNAQGFPLVFTTNSSEKMRITAGGDVGIGIAPGGTSFCNPSLQIKGTSASNAGHLTVIDSAIDSWLSLYSGITAADSPSFMWAASNSLRWGTTTNVGVGSYSEKMRIDGPTGNLGIGTQSIPARLSVLTASSDAVTTIAWSNKHVTVGPSVGSNTGAALGFGYNTTADQAELMSLSPAVAWKKMGLFAAGIDLCAGNGVLTMRLTSGGLIQDSSGNELGFKGIPRTTSGLINGMCFAISAGVTISTGLAAGTAVTIYNDSGSSVLLTQGSGLTLRQAGTANTGNRTLLARGFATIWCNSTTEYVISGNLT